MTPELPVGTLVDAEDGVAAELLADRFNRHTFWCGQSGSGKTYALGVALEQLLLATRLPIVVFDPNSDFVHLGQVRDDAPAEVAKAFAERDIRVFRSGDAEGDSLHVRFVDMDRRARAAALRIDPLHDRAEYNASLHWDTPGDPKSMGEVVAQLRAGDDPVMRDLALRLDNLGVLDWPLWAWGGRAATDEIDDEPDATVLDLGGFAVADELRAAALAVLDHLWEKREERRPRLLVIDEAHNLCPPVPDTPLAEALTERIVQIAAEGRKYGLWLLISTQRPSKVHPNVLTQCDNLTLMRMNAPRDLAELGDVFGFAPPSLLERVPGFAKGQALMAGGFIAQPSVVQMGARLTREGGSDVAVPLR
ncbi:ATP-binding protein [Homoserinibacter sp. GY 40078]|uniref:ATP-binding protein n=1 Tax=Homoserinibacter sp. GY 40078 TaxID=2603275 RepID=UPI0011C9C5A7|nr:ATP-binding protein [Homoserinibacter sp. GY 40078]TXK18983.1 ATP-binding protein [Homoserinibacter sp. GY 40078]